MEERINQLEKLAAALREEANDFRTRYGRESALTRISSERYLRIKEVLDFISQDRITVMDYWLKEYHID